MHKIHSMLAEDSPWARRATIDLHRSTCTACLSIHGSRLLDHWRKLVLHIIDDTAADGLFHLLAEDAPLILIVLEAHLCDLIRDTLVLEILQRPIEAHMHDYETAN